MMTRVKTLASWLGGPAKWARDAGTPCNQIALNPSQSGEQDEEQRIWG